MRSGSWLGIWVLYVLISVSASIQSPAQITTAQKYLITAKAGGVNLVDGDVMVRRADGRSGMLLKGDDVQIGEVVTTGVDGRAEILMNPGSYIRLGANSSFEFASTDLDDVRLKFYKGSAILEVFGTDGFQVDLSTDTARFTVLQTGVYRIDASPDGLSNVAVWKGKMRSGLVSPANVGGGKIVSFDGKTYSITKFDRDDQDELAVWSRDRSRELSKIASTLRPDRLRDPLINSFYGGRWNLYNSFGLWVFDPFRRSYCFLPFGYGWSSPYGFGFARSIWYYNLPTVIYNQPPPPSIAWRGRNMKNADTPAQPVGRTPGSSTGNAEKRPVRVPMRDVVPRQQRSEPGFNFPRSVEPVIGAPAPSAPSGPSKRGRDQ